MENVLIYGSKDASKQVGTVSFNILRDKEIVDPNEVSNLLSTRYNIATRAGFHCAALAHKTLGTEGVGTIRASISYFTEKKEVERLVDAIWKI